MSSETKLSVVADASALIALHQIQLLADLPSLFDQWVIPEAVAREVAPSVDLPLWISRRQLTQPIDRRLIDAALGAGETEVIALAMELRTHSVLLDERAGRKMAAMVGVPIVGTVGTVLAAMQAGIITTVAPRLDQLLAAGFYASPTLISQILALANEAGLPEFTKDDSSGSCL
jgi:predicted nucleic acid-binding protein